MTDTDDMWQRYAQGVKRKTGGKAKVVAKPKPVERLPQKVVYEVPFLPEQPPQNLALSFDRSVERRLRRGDLDLDGKIDLHGMTQAEAFENLVRFVSSHVARGSRRLLIVTGKGREGKSVLRLNLPTWCAAPPLSQDVFALRSAAVQHGGDGAFYLLLKRPNRKDALF